MWDCASIQGEATALRKFLVACAGFFSMLPISGIQDSPVSKFEFILLSNIDFLYITKKNIHDYSNYNICFIRRTPFIKK